MKSLTIWTAALAFLALPLACAHQAAPPAPASAPAPKPSPGGPPSDGGVASDATELPPGCRQDLSGEWEHQDDPSYRYRGTDDGTIVTLLPYRDSPALEDADAGRSDGGEGGMSIELRRSQDGFKGRFRMIEQVSGGRRCPASFDAQLVACEPDKLTLRIEQSYAIDRDCKRVDTGGPDIAEHVLVRRKATEGGAGH